MYPPDWLALTPFKVNVALVAPLIFTPLYFHWYFKAVLLDTTTLMDTVELVNATIFVGCWVICGMDGFNTVMVKLREITLLLAPPSLTVTVIVAEPDALEAGLKVKVPALFGLA